MALTKIGKEGITGIDNSSDATAITISSGEVVTLADDLIIKDSGTIGSASKTDAITIASSGLVQLTSTGIGAGSQVFQVIDDGATLFQLRAEDVVYMKALEAGDSSAQTASAATKKKLRDAPAASAISSADTIAKLKAAWDKDLLGDSPYA